MGEPEVVLVVEDDGTIVHLFKQILGSAGMTTLCAQNAEEALQLFDEKKPQAMLLDLNLPDGDGYSICKNIRSRTSGHHIPIIIISSREDLNSIEQAYACGATDYFTKPVHWPTLAHRIRYLIGACEVYKNSDANLTHNKQAEAKQQLQEKLYSLTHYDSLTGLANRQTFLERFEIAVATAKSYQHHISVLLVDLDHFARINEAFDHQIGDQLLIEITQRLQDILQKINRLQVFSVHDLNFSLARIDGDEFAILLISNLKNQQIAKIAQHIITALNQPTLIQNQEITVGLSIGIAVYPDDGEQPAQLLKNAGVALHHAKSKQKNSYQFYNDTINCYAQNKLLLENDLYHALKNDEFILYYQPKIDLKTGQLIGVETLIRWQHPQHGLLSPDDFITLAEETNLIIEIGYWLIKMACLQTKYWHEKYHPSLQVAINLSMKQFNDKSLIANINNILNEIAFPPKYLEFELTESVLFNNDNATVNALSSLKQLGVRLAIDDFGTGYSSLQYLSQFPLDVIKIDRQFLNEDNPANKAIVQAIIYLGHALNLSVVAEGVETLSQLAMLKQNGCDIAQGYLLSKPLPTNEMTILLEHPLKSFLPPEKNQEYWSQWHKRNQEEAY